MRFSTIILAYFVIGAVMFVGGGIAWDDAGIAKWFIEKDGGQVSPDEETQNKLKGVAGAIKNIVDTFAGPLVVVWNLVVGFIAFIHWPITVLVSHDAPPQATLLLGGPLNAAFYLSLIRLVRTSA